MPHSLDLLTLQEFLGEIPSANLTENTALAAVTRHEGIRCDVCGKLEFTGRRYKCLRCENYDLCGSCRDKKSVNNQHTVDHAMQCILPSSALAVYFGSEYTPFDRVQSFACPHCGEQGMEYKDLLPHLEKFHTETSDFLVWCPVCVCGHDHDLSMTDDLLEHVVHEHDPDNGSHLRDSSSISTTVTSRHSTNSERLLPPPRHRGRFRTTIITSTTANHDVVRSHAGGSLPRPSMLPPSQEFSMVATLPGNAMSISPSFSITNSQLSPRNNENDMPRLTTPPRASTPAPAAFRDRLRERDEGPAGRGWNTGLSSLNARLRAAWAENAHDFPALGSARPNKSTPAAVDPLTRITPFKNAASAKKKAQPENPQLLLDSLLDGVSSEGNSVLTDDEKDQQGRKAIPADRGLFLQDILLATLQKEFFSSSVESPDQPVPETMLSKNAETYKLDGNRLSGQTIYRTDPTQQEMKWQRMKSTLDARRSRILDPILTKINCRKEDLDADVRRLKERVARENEEFIREDNKHKFLENVVRTEKMNEAKAAEAFRKEFQLPQQRRDYDLYDPHRWKSEPLVTYQNPEVQGPAAMMNFEGYKLMDTERDLEAERRKYQREMLDLQTREEAVRRDRQAKIDDLEQEIAAVIANKAEDEHRRGELLRKAEALDNARKNEAMLQDRALHRQARKLDEAKADQDEIHYWTSGKLLDPQPSRTDITRRTDWRGHTRPEQLANFSGPKGVAQQVYDKQMQEAHEAATEKKRVHQSKVQERFAKWEDLQGQCRQLEKRKDIAKDNQAMGEEQRKKEECLYKQVYANNVPTDKFWNQFEASGR